MMVSARWKKGKEKQQSHLVGCPASGIRHLLVNSDLLPSFRQGDGFELGGRLPKRGRKKNEKDGALPMVEKASKS